ncbi:TYRO protein tyrosine kinase-binding protein-like [Protopterus annectens]|uniref:TYRO protein tyrosine kinase-binding protein-like n=1 Tax=Protopterus annectens TaxID=7888 RepID=UPI001CF93867|nr:TYRO protein tyrosine kinase-binding protein-like [Protopterus annectens]
MNLVQLLIDVALLISLFDAVSGQEKKDCDNCYKIEAGTMAGIVVGDVVVTLVIALTVYYCARKQTKKTPGRENLYMNMHSALDRRHVVKQ